MENLIQRLIPTPNILGILALVKAMYPTQQHLRTLQLAPLSFIGKGGLSMNRSPFLPLPYLDAGLAIWAEWGENSGLPADLLGEPKSALPVGQPPFELCLFNG
jgi:hypothetical protein